VFPQNNPKATHLCLVLGVLGLGIVNAGPMEMGRELSFRAYYFNKTQGFKTRSSDIYNLFVTQTYS